MENVNYELLSDEVRQWYAACSLNIILQRGVLVLAVDRDEESGRSIEVKGHGRGQRYGRVQKVGRRGVGQRKWKWDED